MNPKIWIKQHVIDFIFKDGNKWLPFETGGILIGYCSSKTEYVITNVVGPGEKAFHKHFSFEPDQEFHQQEISRIYTKSNRLETYLGDWHTHPNSSAYQSETDKKTLKKIARHKEARLVNPLMLIAAPPKKDFTVWLYKKPNIICGETNIKCSVVIYE
jgi:integrative and conjugative element protein (TIGR02256 family)